MSLCVQRAAAEKAQLEEKIRRLEEKNSKLFRERCEVDLLARELVRQLYEAVRTSKLLLLGKFGRMLFS